MTTRTISICGEKINDWMLIEFRNIDKPGIHWLCRCKCGFEAVKFISSLRRGREKCCRACSSREKSRPSGLKSAPDIIDKKFGKWKVLERLPSRYGGKSYWLCKCECGNIREISGSTLIYERSTKCSSCN